MKKVCIDLDSVMCEFMDPWFDWLIEKQYCNHKVRKEDCSHYQYLHETFGNDVMKYFLEDPHKMYLEKIQPYPGGDLFIRWCEDNFDEVEIVTHSSQESTSDAKRQFVKKYFNMNADQIRFFSVMDEKFEDTLNSVLIDDYPLHIIFHMARNKCPGILFDWDGRNGWSKMANYMSMIEEEQPDFKLFHKAFDYGEAKDALREYFQI